MPYRISKKFAFSASHCLDHMPEGHPCRGTHGHNYEVELVLASEALDDKGMVLDYHDMKPFKDWIDKYLDHTHLNDYIPKLYVDGKIGLMPTAENLARILVKVADEHLNLPSNVHIYRVRVSETPKTWAEHKPK